MYPFFWLLPSSILDACLIDRFRQGFGENSQKIRHGSWKFTMSAAISMLIATMAAAVYTWKHKMARAMALLMLIYMHYMTAYFLTAALKAIIGDHKCNTHANSISGHYVFFVFSITAIMHVQLHQQKLTRVSIVSRKFWQILVMHSVKHAIFVVLWLTGATFSGLVLFETYTLGYHSLRQILLGSALAIIWQHAIIDMIEIIDRFDRSIDVHVDKLNHGNTAGVVPKMSCGVDQKILDGDRDQYQASEPDIHPELIAGARRLSVGTPTSKQKLRQTSETIEHRINGFRSPHLKSQSMYAENDTSRSCNTDEHRTAICLYNLDNPPDTPLQKLLFRLIAFPYSERYICSVLLAKHAWFTAIVLISTMQVLAFTLLQMTHESSDYSIFDLLICSICWAVIFFLYASGRLTVSRVCSTHVDDERRCTY